MRVVVLLMLVLAGCASPDAQPQSFDDDGMVVKGGVYDHAVQPIAAKLTLQEANLTVHSNEAGRFQFPPVEPGLYTLVVEAPDHATATWHLLPSDGNRSLFLRLDGLLTTPTQFTTHHRGHVQCMAEYAIISGDCDRAPDYVNDRYPDGRPVPEPFRGNDTLRADVGNQWETLIIDVAFDLENHPGLSAMRLSVYGLLGNAEVLDYERITQASSGESFTVRIDAGATYDNYTVPQDPTSFRLEVFGEGFGYKEVCAGDCFMGVGAGSEVSFDVYMTTFLVEPAPQGWSILE